LIATVNCDWKCLKEQNLPLSTCQNSHTCDIGNKEIELKELVARFNDNVLSECVIWAGLEPMLQFEEMLCFINEFRKTNNEEVIIFTGYYPEELKWHIEKLKSFSNLIIKFGRYIKNSKPIRDNLLKIELVSENQFSKRIEDL
jgi:pyruvate-formate lyase-activating enzyme